MVTQKNRVAYQGLSEALSKDPMTDRKALQDLEDEIKGLKTREKEIICKARELVKKEDDRGQCPKRPESIPGIGTVTAVTLLCPFRKYKGTSRSEIASLTGLSL